MSETNLLERAIAVVSPKWAAERAQFRARAAYGAWVGARFDRRATQNWQVTQGSSDSDTLPDLPILRLRSRDMVRNDAIAGGAIATLIANTVGLGLSVQPTPDKDALGLTDDEARAWSKDVRRKFNAWAASKDVDITRTHNFYELQALVYGSELESGDSFTLLTAGSIPTSPFKLRLQVLEGDRVATPGMEGMQALSNPADSATATGNMIYGGVECDKFGAPVAYCVLKQHPGSLGFVPQTGYDRFPAFSSTGRRLVLHHFARKRPDQKRGIPILAPVMELLKQLSRYLDAELMAAVVTSMFTVFVKTETGEGLSGIGGVSAQPSAPGRANDIAMGSGAIINLAPNEDVEMTPAPRPNPAFDPFVQAVLRQVGVRLQIPFEVLIKHFTSSYTAARAALLDFWRYVKNQRAHVASGFCDPVYAAWMDEAVSLGIVNAPGYYRSPVLRAAYLACDWIGDAPGSVDPLKEINAAKGRVDLGVSNREIETMELGARDWETVHPQLAREHQMRVAAGLEPPITDATATEMLDEDGPDDDDETLPTNKGGGK